MRIVKTPQPIFPEESMTQWFALYVKLRHEKLISDLLLKKGFESFAPSYLERKPWRDKIHEVEMSLFPGYVFARFDSRYRMPILTTPGVREVVGYGRVPVPVPDQEIHMVREAVNSRLRVEPCQYLETGSRVQIVCGPLAGLEGILEETRSSCRVIISVALIQRSVRVEIERDALLASDVFIDKADIGQHGQLIYSKSNYTAGRTLSR